MARFAGSIWGLSGGSCAHEPLGQSRSVEENLSALGHRRRQRICHGRLDHRSRASAQCWGAPKGGGDQAIGRSKGGLSTKIYAILDALGNPIGFHLNGGQTCDLDGADVLLPQGKADILLADKGYDADQRVLLPLEQAGKPP